VKVKVYAVCAFLAPWICRGLWKDDKTQCRRLHDLDIALLIFLVEEVEVEVEVVERVGEGVGCLMICDDFQAYVERPLRLSTGLSSVDSCGTSPCNHRRHLREAR
jgi:hypothetical protein